MNKCHYCGLVSGVGSGHSFCEPCGKLYEMGNELAKLKAENERYRKGFRLLWEMATDYKTPWVNEVLRHNPYFASLFEDIVSPGPKP